MGIDTFQKAMKRRVTFLTRAAIMIIQTSLWAILIENDSTAFQYLICKMENDEQH
jgi:hypothetical protein